jgi:hypothetical protein
MHDQTSKGSETSVAFFLNKGSRFRLAYLWMGRPHMSLSIV